MSPDEVLAFLPPESDDELTLADDLPASPLDAFRAHALPCPEAWARLSPSSLGLEAGRELDAWCFAGLLFARANEHANTFGRIGFLRLPLRPDDIEAHARLPAPDAAPARAALGVAALLGLAPILSEREAVALVEPSPLLEVAAHRRLLEVWRPPAIVDDELLFYASEPASGPVQLVRANLATRWVDLEPEQIDWRRRAPVDPRALGDATEPLESEAETGEFADATEPLDVRAIPAAPHAPTVRAPVPDLTEDQ